MKFPMSCRRCWWKWAYPVMSTTRASVRKVARRNRLHTLWPTVIVRVRNVEFVGAPAGEMPQLDSTAKRLADRQYSRAKFSALVDRQFLPVLHAKGYLKASFGQPQPVVVKEPIEEGAGEPKNLTLVDVKIEAHPGQQYKLSRLEWSGNREFPTQTLQTMVRARVGQPPNTVQLADELNSVRTLYGSKGYVAASVKVEPDFDDAAGTVALRLNVNEDSVYHMGDLELRGLEKQRDGQAARCVENSCG